MIYDSYRREPRKCPKHPLHRIDSHVGCPMCNEDIVKREKLMELLGLGQSGASPIFEISFGSGVLPNPDNWDLSWLTSSKIDDDYQI